MDTSRRHVRERERFFESMPLADTHSAPSVNSQAREHGTREKSGERGPEVSEWGVR